MSQKQTADQLFAKANEFKAQIDSGKLTPAKLKKARIAYHNFMRRAKKREATQPRTGSNAVVRPLKNVAPVVNEIEADGLSKADYDYLTFLIHLRVGDLSRNEADKEVFDKEMREAKRVLNKIGNLWLLTAATE